MNKETKIYFIGRKQGVGLRRYRLSHLENRRRFEPEGLKDAKDKIKQTRFIQNADVIWVRVRPEHTKDKQRYLIEERLKNIRGEKPIINDISIFDNYDCKDIAFDLWSNAGVTCPSYIKINAKDGKHNFYQEVENIHDLETATPNSGKLVDKSLQHTKGIKYIYKKAHKQNTQKRKNDIYISKEEKMNDIIYLN